MVTTNRGSARLTSALTLNCGAVKTGTASEKLTALQAICPLKAAKVTPATSVTGTA